MVNLNEGDTMASIEQLAQCIILDELSYNYYQQLAKTISKKRVANEPTLQSLDTQLSRRLVRQLNWSSAICSIDTPTHKFCHFFEYCSNQKFTVDSFSQFINDNYWIAQAIEQSLPETSLNLQYQVLVAELDLDCLAKVGWKYFELLLSPELKPVLETVKSITTVDIDSAPATVTSAYLSFVNAVPMLVLLMLVKKGIHAIKQDTFNQTDADDQLTLNYYPSESLFISLLSFEEFLKPAVFEGLNLPFAEVEQLINGYQGDNTFVKQFNQIKKQQIVEYITKEQGLSKLQINHLIKQKLGSIKLCLSTVAKFKHMRLWQLGLSRT